MAAWRVCSLILKVVLIAALVAWLAAAPLAWILRDGLAAGMVETTGVRAALKFAGLWGLPALALAVPLVGLVLLDRWLARPAIPVERMED